VICYVTMNPSHALVREHIRAGGRACALEAGVNGQMITLYDKGSHIPLLWTHLIPATLEGRALHNVQNAMFAAAMAFSLGIKLDAIRQGLRTFDTTFFQAPGRMNVYDEHPFKVMFDYGHNAHAVGVMADLAQRLDVGGGASWSWPARATAATRTCATSPPRWPAVRPLHLPPRRWPARPRWRRSAADHRQGAGGRGRGCVRDQHDPRRAGSGRCRPAHGPAGRPAGARRSSPIRFKR
jgi:hypothetical protein